MTENETGPKAGPQTYVVQRCAVVAEVTTGQGDAVGVGEVFAAWVDVATVEVPPRTIRATVIKKALEEAKISPEVGETWEVRVLDEASAKAFPVGAVQPPPQLRIGGEA